VIIDRRAVRHYDLPLMLLAGALVTYGAILIYSASLNDYPEGLGPGHPMVKQLLFAALGVGVSVAVAWVDYRVFGQAAQGLYALAVLMLAAVLFVGDAEFGSTRWFNIAGQQVQASEVAKLLTIIALARFLADRQTRMHEARVFLESLVLAAIPAGLVLVEPDMGTAVVFGAIWLGMVLVAGAPPRYAMILIGLAVALIPFAMLAVLGDYQRERLELWFNPSSDPLGGGFPIIQSEIGIGSGGLLGQGLTEGSQTQLNFLRTGSTDYIFSVLGEELGFVGAIVLLALFAALLFRGIRAATITTDPFGRLVATGVVVWILFQVFINIAVNIRLVPVTGIPLPFISQGGSSLIMLFAALGLIEGIVIRHKRLEF
jgi:rod shape determining protein RodA